MIGLIRRFFDTPAAAPRRTIAGPKVRPRGIAAAQVEGAFQKWIPKAETLTAEMQSNNYRLIRRRCKEASLNQPVIKKAVYELNDSLVGEAGVRVLWEHDTEAVLERVQMLWKEWTESLDFCVDGELDLEEVQRIVCDEVATVGEIFLQRRLRRGAADEPGKIPWAYQLITPDRVVDDRIWNAQKRRRVVIRGIEYDRLGKPRAYYFYEPIYSQRFANFSYTEAERTMAKHRRVSADRVIHVYNRVDTGFRRGIPLVMTGIVYGWLSKTNDEAQLQKQTIASMFAAFIHDISAEVEHPDGEDELEDLGDRLQAGSIYKLDPGKTVSFPTNPSMREYESFDRSILRKVATSIGISYEALSGDYKQVNYSSARHSHQKYARIMNTIRKKVIIKKLLVPIVKDFVGYLSDMALLDTEGLKWRFVSPKPIIIDPAKEVAPKIQEIRGGLTSWSQAVAASGQDPKEVAKQFADDKKLFDMYDLKFDSDPNYVMQSGQEKGEADAAGDANNPSDDGTDDDSEDERQ